MEIIATIVLICVLSVLGFVLYIGTYNHNMSFYVNLYSFGMYALMDFMFGNGKEEDKQRFLRLRSLFASKDGISKPYPGVVSSHVKVPTRDGSSIYLYFYMPKSFLEEQAMNNKAKYALSFFCHGGGWVMANRNKAEGVLSRYALETNSIITYADYRLAPEFKHPTASNDCYDCFKYLLDHNEEFHIDRNNITLFGDSAGGQISCAIVQMALEEYGRNLFKKLVLIYPCMDSRGIPEDDYTWEERNLIYTNTWGLSGRIGFIMADWYFPNEASLHNPIASPILYDHFEKFPPTIMLTNEYDSLRIPARLAYEKMKKSGMKIRYHCVRNSVHALWGSSHNTLGWNDLVLDALKAEL